MYWEKRGKKLRRRLYEEGEKKKKQRDWHLRL